MNWRIEDVCSLTAHKDVEGIMSVVKVRLASAFLDRFCIGLCLLSERLVDSLDLVASDRSQVLRLQRANQATSIQGREGKIILSLDKIEFERWLHFTLRTLRDGVAEVDHLDVDAVVEGRVHETTSVVIAFPSSMPPVSADEARSRLGM